MEFVLKPDPRVLLTIAGQAAAHAQTWSRASAATFRKLLFQFYGCRMSPRSWHRHYHSWERLGAIEVRHRHKRNRAGQLELHSNVTVLKAIALNMLNKLRHAVKIAAESPAVTLWNSAMPIMALRGTSTTLNRSTSAAPPPKIDQGAPRAPQKTLNTIMERWRSRIQT